MKEADISKALGQHLMTLADVPSIVWENKDKPDSVSRPYLVVQMVRVSRKSLDLAGGGGITSRGFMQITIVHELDNWAKPAEELADRIAAHFRKGTKLSENGGTVTVMDSPNVLTALRDESDWRVPIQIDYWAS
ncbi:MAG: phage tail terminator-like protein [Sulfitobacter sp.]